MSAVPNPRRRRSEVALPEASIPTSENLLPAYAAQSTSAAASRATTAKPTNYLSLSRSKNSIQGTYTIDPSLSIPSSLLPAKGKSESNRKNLKLESTFGSIDADIRIVGSATTGYFKAKTPRAVLSLESWKGSILAKVRTPTSPRPCFHLIASTMFGSTLIYLPRSFEGLVTITSMCGTVEFSKGVKEHITPFSEIGKTRQCFVGDFSMWGEDEDKWKGDEVTVHAKFGGVRVQYEDEGKEITVVNAKGQGFFSRVFR